MYDQDQIAKPKFDPSKTFTPVNEKPAFNPSQKFESADQEQPVKKKDVGTVPSQNGGVGGTLTGNGQQSGEDKPLYNNVDPSKYETKLSPQDESKFQSWLDNNYKQGKIQKGDYDFYKKNGYGYDYDFRAAYQQGLKPEINTDDKKWHWGDIGKKPNEPTFSNQSKYNGVDGYIGGTWKGNQFIAPKQVGTYVPQSVGENNLGFAPMKGDIPNEQAFIGKDPLGDAQRQADIIKNQPHNQNQFNNYRQASSQIRDISNVVSTNGKVGNNYVGNLIGDDPNKYSIEQLQQKVQGNKTAEASLSGISDKRKVDDAIATTTDPYRAAIKYATGKENEEQGNITDEQKGEYVRDFLNNPNVIEAAKSNPKFGQQYRDAKFNWMNDFPSTAQKDIEQKIGQYLENNDETNWAYNNVGQDKADKAVNELFNSGQLDQHQVAIYKQSIRPDLGTFKSAMFGSKIPTSDVVNTFTKSLEDNGGNIYEGARDAIDKISLGTISALGEGRNEHQKRVLENEYSTPTIETKSGFLNGTNNVVNMLGFATPAILGEMAGIPSMGTMGFQFYGGNKVNAMKQFPDNQNLQDAYAALTTGIDLMAGEKLPIKGAGEEITSLLKGVDAGTTTMEEAKNKYLNFAKNFVSHSVSGANSLALMKMGHNAADEVFSGKNINAEEDAKNILSQYPQDLLAMSFFGGIAAAKHLKGKITENEKIRQQLNGTPTEPQSEQRQPTAGGEVAAQSTGKEVRQESIVPQSENIHTNENYRTMDMGNDEGKDETKEARTQMKERFSNGDVPIDGENGKGETGKQFAARALSQWIDDKNNQPNNTTIVTHSSVLKAIKAYEDMKDKPEDVNNFSPEQWKEFSDNYNKESTENGDLETFKGTNGDIHVIRHGQTVDNEENKFRSGDTNLTDKGIKQAKVSGQELKEKTGGNVPKIITSDLPRAIHSSNLIHSELTGEKPRIRVSAEQLEAAQPKGESEVPQQNKVVEGTTEGEGGKRTGISHKSLSDLADRIGLPKPQEGSYMPLAWYRDRGRKLLDVGADIKQLETDFKNGKQPSADDISVATAHTDDLENIANSMGDKWGMDSNQYKDAKTELNRFKDEVAKPMGTKAGEAFYSLQSLGERNTDTGSHTSLSSAFEEDNKKAPNAKQSQELKDISDKYTQLKKDFDDLRNGISNGGKVKASLADQARSFAKDLRSGDKNILPAWLRADLPKGTKTSGFTLNEAFAKALETFADIHDKTKDFAQAIDAAVKHLSKWFEENNVKYNENDLRKNLENEVTSQFPEAKNIKKLKKELDDLQNGIAKQKNPKRELTEREKELKEQIKDEKEKLGLVKSKAQKPLTEQEQIDEDKKAQEQKEKTKTDLQNRFVNKTDNKFEPKDAKDVWNYINNKLDGGTDFDNAVQESAADLGLSVEQVQNAIASDKTIKSTTDKLYKNQRERSKLKRDAEYYIKAAGDKKGIKILRALTAIPRGLKIFGHGTVPMETHAGMSKFDVDPESAKIYYKNLAKTYRLYGSSIYYEKAVQMYKSDPTYHLFNAMGLAGDFGKTYEDYLLPNTWWKGTPVGKLQEASKRGFDILKFHRHDLMKMHYNKLSAEEKQDPELLKTYADIVNHQTGNVKPIFRPESTVGKVAEHSFFALKLEGSRWAGITDVGKAIATLMDKDASKADKVRAKMVTWRAARLMGAYMGALALNQGLLSATGSNQKINGIPKFLGGAGIDLSKSDFLDMKMFGKHFGVVGGMSGVIRFIGNLIRAPFESKQQLHGKSVLGTWEDLGTSYLRGKASPLAGDVIDVGTHHDAQGNTLPFFNDKPLHHYNHKLSVGEYISKFSPIPIEGAVNNIKDEMENNGVKKADAETILKGISSGVMEGATGIRIGEDFSKNGTKNGLGGGGSSGTYMTVKNPTTFKERPATDDEIKKVNQTVEKNLPTALDKFKNNATKIWVDVNDKIHTSKIGGNETEREKGTWKAVKYDDLTDDQKSQLEKKVKDKVSKEAEKQLKY